jgi:hypothetical protein
MRLIPRPFFLHQKPRTDLKDIDRDPTVTYIPSGEAAWPAMRSTRTLEENIEAGQRIQQILSRNGRRPS